MNKLVNGKIGVVFRLSATHLMIENCNPYAIQQVLKNGRHYHACGNLNATYKPYQGITIPNRVGNDAKITGIALGRSRRLQHKPNQIKILRCTQYELFLLPPGLFHFISIFLQNAHHFIAHIPLDHNFAIFDRAAYATFSLQHFAQYL